MLEKTWKVTCVQISSTGAKFLTTVTLAQFTWREKFHLLRLLT